MRQVFLPDTMEDLFRIMERESGVAIYAGGTDFLVKMRSGLLQPSCLVCLERVQALQGILDRGQEILIGAGATLSRVLDDALINEHFPVLIKALSVLASPPIRHMGTIGGNIVTASPAGDTLPALYVLAAEVEIRSAKESRRILLRDFIFGPGTVDLRRGEILTGVWLSKVPEWTVHHYEKVGRRKAQACAVASRAAVLRLSDQRRIENARLAWGSVGPTVVISEDVERLLKGKPLSVETLEEAANLVYKAVSPIDDIRAGAEYRRRVAGNLLFRLLDYRDPNLQLDRSVYLEKSQIVQGV